MKEKIKWVLLVAFIVLVYLYLYAYRVHSEKCKGLHGSELIECQEAVEAQAADNIADKYGL
jgi:hypothetical protein